MKSTDDEKFVPLISKFRTIKKANGIDIDTSVLGDPHVFITSPSLANEIHKLCHKDGFGYDLKELKLPFKDVFVEIPLTPEIFASRPLHPGTQKIVRMGARITEAGEGSFSFWPIWEFADGRMGFGQALVILSPTPGPLTTHLKIGNIGAEMHYMCLPPPILVKHLISNGVSPQEASKRFNTFWSNHPNSVDETLVEVPFMLAAWSIVINSKTGVKSTPIRRVPPSGAGKRLKALMSAKYTVLSLSAVETVCPRGQTKRRHDLNAHYVRGHFKQRKSGIYWWQPFVRGTGAVNRREAYIVKP